MKGIKSLKVLTGIKIYVKKNPKDNAKKGIEIS